MKIMNDISIKCNECNNIMNIDKEEPEHGVSSSERGMGPEHLHEFKGLYNCDKCQNEIDFTITGSEYPSNSLNHQSEEIDGGTFINDPILEILYVDEIPDDYR